jgi:hypothetical protein
VAGISFLVGFLVLGAAIAHAGGRRPEAWRRWCAVAMATSLPIQVWAVMWIRDCVVFGHGLVPEDQSARFGFHAGLALTALATPVWLVAGLLGLRFGMRRSAGAEGRGPGREPRLTEGDGVVFHDPANAFSVFRRGGVPYLSVLTGGVGQYFVTIRLDEREAALLSADREAATALALDVLRRPSAHATRMVVPSLDP